MRHMWKKTAIPAAVCAMLLLSACGAAGGGTNHADGSRTTTADAITAGQPDGTEDENEENASKEGTGNTGTGQSENDASVENVAYTTHLPVAVQIRQETIEVPDGEYTHSIFREYPELTVGEYEWDGNMIPPQNRRYDALEARLNMLNGEFADDSGIRWLTDYLSQGGFDGEDEKSVGYYGSRDEYNGNVTMQEELQAQITRSDEKAVSLILYSRSDVLLSAIPVRFRTYVLDPETGKDLRLKSVVKDMDAFIKTALALVRKEMPDAPLAEAEEEENGAEEAIQELWTLDYDGVTVYMQLYNPDDVMNVPCVTVPFADYPELFEEAFTAHPENYLTEMIAGRAYKLPDRDEIVRVDHEAVTDTDTVPQHPLTLTVGEQVFSDHYAKNHPPHYLVRNKGKNFILMEPPHFDVSATLYRYDLNTGNTGEPERIDKRIGSHVTHNPERMLLYDDAFQNGDAMNPDMPCVAYAYYRMEDDGSFVCEDDARFLESPAELTARQQVETLGYRRHDKGTLVSKTLTRGMVLKPYRTDRKTYLEFESGGDVFRFDLENYGADMKLNGVYTISNLFGQ